MHSKQWHYSLHRDFQNCYSTRRSPTGFFSSNSSSNSTRAHYTTIQRILHPESNSTCRRQRALRILLLHTEGKETFSPDSRKKFYAQKARRSSRNPSVCLTRHSRHSSRKSLQRQLQLLQRHSSLSDIPVIPVVPDTPETFQAFQSFMTFQPFQAILQCSSISRESTPFQHSPIRMHILHILQFLQFDWFPQKTPPSTSWTIQTTNIHSSKKGRCCDIGQTCIGKDVKMTYFLE